jgi:hypothetical protein
MTCYWIRLMYLSGRYGRYSVEVESEDERVMVGDETRMAEFEVDGFGNIA